MVLVFHLSVLIACAAARQLPDYITPCHLGENFEKCAVDNGNKAISKLVNGDKNFKISNHAPLVIPEVILQSTRDLVTKLTNFEINFEGVKLQEFKHDPLKKTIKVKAGKDFFLKGNYEINGRILLLPIQGEGRFNATYEGLIVEYTCSYDLVTKKSDGKKYVNLVNDEVRATSKFLRFYFDNLFNGNKELGEETNVLLNENRKELEAEFEPAIEAVMKKIIRNFVTAYITSVPYDSLFLS